MANGVFQATVINERTGKPCALARVTVLTAGNTLANLFADRAGTRTMKNPMITDLQGFVRCYAVAGTYTIKTDHDLGSQTLTGVQFIDAASGSAKELLDTKILQSETGLPAPFAKVTVLTSAGSQAALFSASDETQSIENPIIADEFGVLRCKLVADRYDLLAEFHTGATRIFKDVVMPNYALGDGGTPTGYTSDQYWSGNIYSWTGSFWQMGNNQWGSLDPTGDETASGYNWEVGYRPTSLELTVHANDLEGDGFIGASSYFELRDTVGNVIGTVVFDFSDGMSQTKTMAITFVGFDIGLLYQTGYVYSEGPHIDSIFLS